jgi:hypothetical protein
MSNIAKFLKTYLLFMTFILTVNMLMEIVVVKPETLPIIEEYSWGYFIISKLTGGILIMYALYDLLGTIIYYKLKLTPIKMGLIGLAVGMIMEFFFMKPDWVMRFYSLDISFGVIGGLITTAFYWYIPWAAPPYLINKSKKLSKFVGSD